MELDTKITYKSRQKIDNKFLGFYADYLLPDQTYRPHKDLIFTPSAFFVYGSHTCSTFCFAPTRKATPNTKQKELQFTQHT